MLGWMWVSYRMLFDFFALEMTHGVSESGYIRAFNRRRRMLCGTSLKECPKSIFIKALEDFEHTLEVDEVEAFTCEKCPSEESSGEAPPVSSWTLRRCESQLM